MIVRKVFCGFMEERLFYVWRALSGVLYSHVFLPETCSFPYVRDFHFILTRHALCRFEKKLSVCRLSFIRKKILSLRSVN